ncbi:MAG: ribosomal protein S18-alanine N-acetyltransferase, partial [Deltaproteobacteria bacterium]|nr:ribosomal protein S18-alanine N-acetyltransferase [Deltaproteobacteria bacterium]
TEISGRRKRGIGTGRNMPANDLETLVIGAMAAGDVEEVLAIERVVFPAPWTENMFRQELLLPLARNLTARIGGGRIAGYLNFWFIAGEVHIHHIAVRKDQQGKGVASALLRAMVGLAYQEGARYATLEVRSANEPARRLYERFGFEVRGIRPLYYDDTTEDALIMWADLGERLDDQQ